MQAKLKRKSKAFSLIELLVAILIFSIIFLGSVRSLRIVDRLQKNTEELAIANQILSDIAEQIIEAGWDSLVIVDSDGNPAGWNAKTVGNFTATMPLLTALDTPQISIQITKYNALESVKQIKINFSWIPFGSTTSREESFSTLISRSIG